MKKKLSFKKAAIKILGNTKEPLSAKEITKIAIEEDLIETSGQTPEATMAAQIYVDINDEKKATFKKVGKGKFALIDLNQSVNTPLFAIENQNNLVKEKLISKLHEMDPFQFEYLAAELLRKIGYEDVEVTKRSGDKGIDVNATLTVGGLTDVSTVIQVKRYKKENKLAGRHITQLRGSAEVGQRGLIITTSDFTKDAIEESKAKNKTPVALVNGKKLIELMFKYNVGVKSETIDIYTFDNELFETDLANNSNNPINGKNKSLWPLPGGAHSYIATLNLLLSYISTSKNTTNDDLISWFIKSFDNVSSKKTAYGYIGVPKSMGLIKLSNNKYQLTEDGIRYFSSKSLKILFEIISKNIVAFEEVYQLLKNSTKPKNEIEIREFINDNFDVNWSSNAQTSYRLLWLINLNLVTKKSSGYFSN